MDLVESMKAQGAAMCAVFNEKDIPQEKTLHCALQSALGEVSTSTADLEGLQKFVPQDNDLKRRLKNTDTLNKKKMSNFRQHLAIASEVVVKSEKSRRHSHSGSIETRKQRQNRRELMNNAVDAVSSMVVVIGTKSSDLTRAVQKQTNQQSEDIRKRHGLRENHVNTLQSEELDRKMNRLILLRDHNVITDEEIEEKMNAFLQL